MNAPVMPSHLSIVMQTCQHIQGAGILQEHYSNHTFKITKGAVREYQSTGENGSEIYRGFCENCGSPVATRLTRLPQVIGIPAEVWMIRQDINRP